MRRRLALLLPGARLGDRLVACGGAGIGIALTALFPHFTPMPLPAIAAPMGASAVLLFAVPASPLAQPWPILGGNTLSALIGVAAARSLGTGPLAAGAAVTAAILLMSLLRCLHPPGGAVALSAVVGGPAVAAAGWRFALVPVALDSAVLVTVGLLFHLWSGHRYPHRPNPAAPAPRFAPEDLETLLAAAEAAADRRLAAR